MSAQSLRDRPHASTTNRRLGVLIAIAAALAFAGAAQAVPAVAAGGTQRSFEYGDVVRVAPRTLMVVGRPLVAEKGEADAANAIVYRSGRRLYVIDTGATPSFRPFLREAIRRLRPFREVVLINTHGHPDHIGNNALVAGVRARSFRHYMSRRDFALSDNYQAALTGIFRSVTGYVPVADPVAQAHEIFDLFMPLEQSHSTRRPIESLPLRRVHIGRLRTRGWMLGSDDVVVIRTAGHTAGELIVYFPRTRLLHMGDELNSYYPAFPEACPDRVRRAFVHAVAAAAGGGARLLTDGHTFSVLRGAARIRARVRDLIDGYDAYGRVVKRLLRAAAPVGATVGELIEGVGKSPALRRAPGGANPGGPFYAALSALNKLRQVHATATGGPRETRRFNLPSR
jgi:glyoxylase-like metal-dependent hydrolase (beta-lactamase superfamily II)